jgi:mannose-6-phosphate isomerase-like protein (cupin superfamily)
MKTRYRDVPAFVTKDGSEIRELMHPQAHGNRAQSLAETADATSLSRGPRLISIAEAIVQPGEATTLHRHAKSEELYHITAGHGWMTLGDEAFAVSPGDTVCIPPGTPHCIRNTGPEPLRILCACAPAYTHEDTEVMA